MQKVPRVSYKENRKLVKILILNLKTDLGKSLRRLNLTIILIFFEQI
jgi:hypothetical protein